MTVSRVTRGPARPMPSNFKSYRLWKERLSLPEDYYNSEGIKLTGRGPWRDALCPFHDDSKPSLRVLVKTGAFKCMACGACGGDVLAFHRLRHGLDFIDAAQALGAWGIS